MRPVYRITSQKYHNQDSSNLTERTCHQSWYNSKKMAWLNFKTTQEQNRVHTKGLTIVMQINYNITLSPWNYHHHLPQPYLCPFLKELRCWVGSGESDVAVGLCNLTHWMGTYQGVPYLSIQACVWSCLWECQSCKECTQMWYSGVTLRVRALSVS